MGAMSMAATAARRTTTIVSSTRKSHGKARGQSQEGRASASTKFARFARPPFLDRRVTLDYGMPRYLIYAEGQFGTPASKTRHSVVRYSADSVAAVLDSKHAGKSVQSVLGFGGDIPIVASLDDGVALGADALLVRIATHGAGFSPELRAVVLRAIDNGMAIWNGLHRFVSADSELASLARIRGVEIHDVRMPPDDLPVGTGRVRELDATVILAVGTDANI